MRETSCKLQLDKGRIENTVNFLAQIENCFRSKASYRVRTARCMSKRTQKTHALAGGGDNATKCAYKRPF